MSLTAQDRAMRRRAAARRARMVGNVAQGYAEAEQWDLEFWQRQTPQMRLSALTAMRRDLAAIKGRNKQMGWDE